jgi:hypothetical protein
MLNSGHSLHFFFAFREDEQELKTLVKTNNEIIKRIFFGLLTRIWGLVSFSEDFVFC